VRALLIVNPNATATTQRGRDILLRALGSDLKIDVANTTRRGHAAELATQAVDDELDVVVALGGDGTVNEVVNGLLAGGTRPDLPALAVVPGGSANVFSRTLGLSANPVEATSEVLDALRDGRRRLLGLGLADERWFTFCAGIGFDAEVVRQVEISRRDGHSATPARYVRTAIRHFFTGTDRRRPALSLLRPGLEPTTGLSLAIVSNSSPWTYLGSRPVIPSPTASFDTGLDVVALRRLGTAIALRTVRRILSANGGMPSSSAVLSLRDEAEFTVLASRPLAVQIDGDYIGTAQSVRFRSIPRALTVIA
jgi:diacylglycerol kinase family enzyme